MGRFAIILSVAGIFLSGVAIGISIGTWISRR